MVSPLRIWQYSEPKGLWPALGGLAVVAHVGVIGLSLPYVDGLMGGGMSTADIVPVELIVTPDDERLAADATEASLPVEPPTVSASSPVNEVIEEETPQPQIRPVEQPRSNSVLEDEETAETEEETLEKEEETTTDAEEIPSETDKAEGTTPQNTDTPEQASVGEEEKVLGEQPQAEDPALPAIEGESLPSPGAEPAGNGADQVTSLGFASYDYVPDELRIDRVGVTLPAPQQTAAVSMRPQDVGCEEVTELPPMPLTYRVQISAAGMIQDGTPWKGNNGVRSLSPSESAIVCLLKRSGWTFTPATVEGGEFKPNSDLLLTFSLNLSAD